MTDNHPTTVQANGCNFNAGNLCDSNQDTDTTDSNSFFTELEETLEMEPDI